MIEKRKFSGVLTILFFSLTLITMVTWLLVVQNETSKALDRPSDLLSLEDTLRNLNMGFALVTLIFIVLEMICAFIALNYLNKLIDHTNDNS